MIVVSGDDQIFADFLLHADAETVRERCGESAVDVRRQNLCGNRGMRQSAERSPEKEAGRFADRDAGGVRVLLRSEARQLLYVRDVDYGVRGNERVSWRHHFVETIDADEELRNSARKTRRTRHVSRSDLRV